MMTFLITMFEDWLLLLLYCWHSVYECFVCCFLQLVNYFRCLFVEARSKKHLNLTSLCATWCSHQAAKYFLVVCKLNPSQSKLLLNNYCKQMPVLCVKTNNKINSFFLIVLVTMIVGDTHMGSKSNTCPCKVAKQQRFFLLLVCLVSVRKSTL